MKKFAVFDIDGTLIRWQLYHAAVNTLAKDGLLGKDTYDQIRSARRTWKERRHPDAFKHYEKRLVQLYDQAVRGISTTQFQRAADSVLEEYKNQVYVYSRDLIKSLKKQHYFLLAVSGSNHELVEMFAKHYGFDDWVGSRYLQVEGRYSGAKRVASKDKGRVLEFLVKKHDLSYEGSVGVGDTSSDIPLLEKVERPIAFNPERGLYETAVLKGWKIVIERKNMIYELEPRDGSYVLAQTNAR